MTAVKTAKQFLTFVSGGPFQYAIAEALALPDEYYAKLRDDLMAQRDLLMPGLRKIGFEVYQPQGTYFVTEFCRTLPERAGVVAIPSAVFYDHKEAARSHVRFAFCKRPEVLTEALSRLSRAFLSRTGLVPAPVTSPVPPVPAPWWAQPHPGKGSQAHGGTTVSRTGWEQDGERKEPAVMLSRFCCC